MDEVPSVVNVDDVDGKVVVRATVVDVDVDVDVGVLVVVRLVEDKLRAASASVC